MFKPINDQYHTLKQIHRKHSWSFWSLFVFMKVALIFISVWPAILFNGKPAWPLQDSGRPDAAAIIRKSEDKMLGKTSFSLISIKTIRPGWSREMKLKTWTKGKQYAMILVTYPAKEKGTVFLKSNKEVWSWMPSIERTVKLPPSMMTQSWMGTDFTNDDLVKESSIQEDYVHSFEGDSVIGGKSCYCIKLLPKPESAVVWGKILTWIDKTEYIQMRTEFYDEENILINTMQSSEIKRMGGRTLPGKITMVPADKPGNSTVMYYDSIAFDKPLEDNFFTPGNMKKVK